MSNEYKKDKKFSDLLRRLVVDPDLKEEPEDNLKDNSVGVDIDGEAQGWQNELSFE